MLGLNWSAPKARLHGLMPLAPTTRKPKALARKINCHGVGPVHCVVPQGGGWRPDMAAVSGSISIPCSHRNKMEGVVRASTKFNKKFQNLVLQWYDIWLLYLAIDLTFWEENKMTKYNHLP